MDKKFRQQLTLFIDKKDAAKIESIRKTFDPIQHQLIDSHVTLCREDEIQNIDKVLYNLQNLDTPAITIQFEKVTRFDNDKGILLPASGDNVQFHQLRKKVLTPLNNIVRSYKPHITLMHPRNSTCTDEIFETIQSIKLPAYLTFNAVSLIEQIDEEPWQIIKTSNLK